jgi:hypothetical protein
MGCGKAREERTLEEHISDALANGTIIPVHCVYAMAKRARQIDSAITAFPTRHPYQLICPYLTLHYTHERITHIDKIGEPVWRQDGDRRTSRVDAFRFQELDRTFLLFRQIPQRHQNTSHVIKRWCDGNADFHTQNELRLEICTDQLLYFVIGAKIVKTDLGG